MSETSRELIRRSGYSNEGFASGYDEHRPSPPAVMLQVVCVLAQTERPQLVVDFGSGTGLSTRVWADRAEEVVGIEPNPAMRIEAEARTDAPNVRYLDAFSSETGLPDACADIVTCSQSFHWMEPESTLAEAARLLRPGGVFVAYDYELPPVVHPEIDEAFERYHAARRTARRRIGVQAGADRHPKHEHLSRIRESGLFATTREVLVHSIEEGNATRVVGLARSIGMITGDVSEEELGLPELEATAHRVLGERSVPWYLGYRVRVGIR